MEKSNLVGIFTVLIIILTFWSCKEEIPWQTHESGLQYRLISHSELGSAVKPGDVLILKMKYKSEDDSLLFDTREISGPYRMQCNEPSHTGGSIEDAFTLLHVGDSMHCKVNARKFYEETRHTSVPKEIDPESYLLFEIRLSGIQTMSDIEKERRALRHQNADEEQKLLDRYLKIQNIEIEPSISGLYFIEIKTGTGKQAIPGKEVSVHYTGKLIDGMVFDSSFKRNQPLNFVLGSGEVIAGLDEGVAKMKKGGKARLVIPSIIAYGEKQIGPIPPFSTLIFEIELLDVK